ncbi:hypothetical protein [Saccharopolyspora taberi]|uniref:Rpo operon protein n=1 Tax=Saccharopolyspora taberi TaxID=60895 RepID=A0ABN3V0M6_9PSEU
MFPKPSTLTEGYSETTTTAVVPLVDLSQQLAVARETHVDHDGITAEVSLSAIDDAGCVVDTLTVTRETAVHLAIALIEAALGGAR